MSTFSGINIAARALGAAQRGMEVTGQNIANVNTEGYSRQRVEQSASVLNQTGTFTQKYVPGDGVVVNGLTRVSDTLATATARQDSASAQEQSTAATTWAGIENALGDVGASGLSQNLSELSSAWNDLASKGGSTGLAGAQSLVITRSETVATQIVGMNSQLEDQYDQLGLQAQTLTTQANTIATNVARLNTSIRETQSSGASANELMDQRDQYLNQLADVTGSRVVTRDNGTVDVLVGNATIVSGDFSYELKVTATNADGTAAGKADIGNQLLASIGGQSAGPVTGSLKATLDGANKTLVDQQKNLDAFATTLTSSVNKNYDGQFFTSVQPGWTPGTSFDSPVKASQLAVAVTSTTFRDSTTATGDKSSDRSYANQVSAAFGDVKSTWAANVTSLAASTQSASNRAELSSQVSLNSGAVRDGFSGVNLDEEMTNLVSYQHAYAAAAKVLTAMDDALATLLNMVR
ncbi:MAG: flagellar hook-associated protein FlgK [Janthinobacterium lividum]